MGFKARTTMGGTSATKAATKTTARAGKATTRRKTTRRGPTAAKSSKLPAGARSAAKAAATVVAEAAGEGLAPRTFQALLECGGQADCAEELATLLSMSVDVLSAMRDKRKATSLLATPARMRLPARRIAHVDHDDHAEHDAG